MPVKPVPNTKYRELMKAQAEARVAAQKAASADVRLRRVVAQLRQGGSSWTAIGDALRISRQAAQQRYGAGASS